MIIDDPLTYTRLPGKHYRRELQWVLERYVQDSLLTRDSLYYADTLRGRTLQTIIRRSEDELAGEHPHPWYRIGRPAVGIALGVGVIVALFYMRSE